MKIYELENGKQVHIEVSFCKYERKTKYNIKAYTREKGKRKWENLLSLSSFEYKRLNSEEKAEYRKNKLLELLGKEMIADAINEYWLSLKPTGEEEFEVSQIL